MAISTSMIGPPAAAEAKPSGAQPGVAARLLAVDALRGLVIVLMVLDHVRDFFHLSAFTADPMALDSGDAGVFLTRWVTQLCAPTFVFLSGLSVWLQRANGKSPAEVSRGLLTRGLWLIFLELTVIGVGFNFGWWIFLQVIWAIGFGMIALAVLSRAPVRVVLVLGLVLIGGHSLLGAVPAGMFGDFELVWRALAERGPVPTPAGLVLVAYPALPWLGVMLLGFGLGPILVDAGRLRARRALFTGAILTAVFLVGRGLNLPGLDPAPWAPQSTALWSAFSFVSATKNPPSPAYVLMTVGLALILLAAFTRAAGRLTDVLVTFGRTPLFTYLMHIWVAHGLALAAGTARGVAPGAFLDTITDPSRLIAAGWGFGLPGVYLAWIGTLLLLYPPARWLEALKRRRRDWWLGYI